MVAILVLVPTVLAIFVGITSSSSLPTTHQNQEDPAVSRFRDYLRLDAVHPDPDYESSIDWIKAQAEDIGLLYHYEEFPEPEGSFVVLLTWNGTRPELPSILFNSHMDVVAVDYDKWDKCDPFSADKDEEGNICGRGANDMKPATAGLFEAVRRLKEEGFVPFRTLYFSILPDEEVGARRGMKPFVNSTLFSSLNIGFDLDEGVVNPEEEILICYGEKSIWQFTYTAHGMSDHASSMPNTTAGDQIRVVLDRIFDFRNEQLQFLIDNPNNMTVDDITSVNLVRMGGGIGNNIIPDELWAQFDMRVLLKPNWDFTDVELFLEDVAQESGANLSFIQKSLDAEVTEIGDTSVWWRVLQHTCDQMNVTCIPKMLSGATDGRYVRNKGIPVYGIMPITGTVKMSHQNNEMINEQRYLEGVERYVALVRNFASVGDT